MPEDDKSSLWTEESYYERAYPAAEGKDGSKEGTDESTTSRRGAEDGFAALTDEEYVKVMAAIGIIPEFPDYSESHLDSVLSKDAARARIEGWFAASPDRAQMGPERRAKVTRRMTEAYALRIAGKDRASVKKLLGDPSLPPAPGQRAARAPKQESAPAQPKAGSPPKSKSSNSKRRSAEDTKKSSVKERTASPP